MLASQFLNVVIEENKDESESDEKEDLKNNNNVMSALLFKTKLPNVLLSECTIELCRRNEKRELPELRFEASLSPSVKKHKVLNPDVNIYPALPKETTIYKQDIAEKQNIEDLLQGVEAVYSDVEDEEYDGNGDLGEKGSKCNVCGRTFYRNCSLAIHLKSHCCVEPTPVKAYRCEVCGKSYAQRSVLKKHSIVHTGDRLKCSLCGIDFTQRSSLLRHCKRLHGLKTTPD